MSIEGELIDGFRNFCEDEKSKFPNWVTTIDGVNPDNDVRFNNAFSTLLYEVLSEHFHVPTEIRSIEGVCDFVVMKMWIYFILYHTEPKERISIDDSENMMYNVAYCILKYQDAEYIPEVVEIMRNHDANPYVCRPNFDY